MIEVMSPLKFFKSKASLNSFMPRYVNEFGIPELLSTLFSLSIRAFSLPKSLLVVAEIFNFFP